MYVLLTVFGLLLLGLSVLITPISARVAEHIGGLDRPEERKMHRFTTPRMGGLGIAILFFGGIFILSAFGLLQLSSQMTVFMLSLLAITTLGLLDDLKNISALTKLFAEIVLASLLFTVGLRSSMIIGSLPLPIDYLFTIGWFIVISNAVNLIDGLDGLATSTALILSLSLALSITIIVPSTFSLTLLLPLLLFMLVLLGFYHWNRPPAVIFLGDSGSLFIGWFLAGYSLYTAQHLTSFLSDNLLIIPALFLYFGYPLSDTLLSITRRLSNCHSSRYIDHIKSILIPDKMHIHHHLQQKYKSASIALRHLQLLNLTYCTLALFSLASASFSSLLWLRWIPLAAGLILLSSLLFWQHSAASPDHIQPQHPNFPPTL